MDFRLPNFDETKILKIQINFWERKSAIKCVSRAFFLTCHSWHVMTFASPRLFTCLVYVSTYCVPIAHLRQNKPFPLLYLGHAQIKKRWNIDACIHLLNYHMVYMCLSSFIMYSIEKSLNNENVQFFFNVVKCLTMCSYVWLGVAVFGYVLLCVATLGYVWPCVAM